MSIRATAALPLLLALAVTACDGGEDSSTSNVFCRAIADNGATVTTNLAPNASMSNDGSLFDGNLGTAATLTTGGAGASSFRGTLNNGSEPAGEVAGFYFSGASFLADTTEVSITTYLDGIAQESGPGFTSVFSGDGSFIGRQTNLDFDAIEITITPAGDVPSISIHELCVR